MARICRKHSSLVLAVSVALITSGCAVGPDYTAPPEFTPIDNWRITADKVDSAPYTADTVEIKWWAQFNDPVLDNLIETAIAKNRDLRITGLRILEARAQLGFARGTYWPQQQSIDSSIGAVELFGRSGEVKDAGIDSFQGAGATFNIGWETDFWGRYKRFIESADASLSASAADYNAALLLLVGEVARGYINVRTLQNRIRLAKENVEIQQNSLSITEARFRGGQVSELDVQLANILLSNTQAGVPRLEARLNAQLNALSVLLGEGLEEPGSSTQAAGQTQASDMSLARQLSQPRGYGEIPKLTASVATGLPVDLLRRRPDIAAAERRLAAQSSRIGLKQAELYPFFNLGGIFGWSGGDNLFAKGTTGSNDPFDPSSGLIGGSFGFSWNIFNYGRITNQVRVEDARFQQLISVYENTVLKAYEEVETSLSVYANGLQETVFLENSVVSSIRAVELSNTQYVSGIADYSQVLESLRYQVNQQDTLATVEGQTVNALITLFQSLGGGWQAYADRPQVSPDVQQQMRDRTNWGKYLPADSPSDMKRSYPGVPKFGAN